MTQALGLCVLNSGKLGQASQMWPLLSGLLPACSQHHACLQLLATFTASMAYLEMKHFLGSNTSCCVPLICRPAISVQRHLRLSTIGFAGPAINHFQQVESKGAIFWEPLVLAIGVAEAYRVGRGWETPTSEKFYALRVSPLELWSSPCPLLQTKSSAPSEWVLHLVFVCTPASWPQL